MDDPPDDLESIADQNSRHGNVGTRSNCGVKRGHGRFLNSNYPKWRNQLRAIKVNDRKRAAGKLAPKDKRKT
jgi:hypothetical protein